MNDKKIQRIKKMHYKNAEKKKEVKRNQEFNKYEFKNDQEK